MRYKVIDNKRLNVYLTKNDLKKENVTIEDVIGGNERTVLRIKKIFKVVSKLAHFNINNRLLNIVLMPIVDGDLIISAGISEDLCTDERVMFEFENFEDFLAACLIIGESGLLSSLYIMMEKYYLIVEKDALADSNFEDKCTMIAEYGKKSVHNILSVAEHGKVIVKKFAVEKMLKVFF